MNQSETEKNKMDVAEAKKMYKDILGEEEDFDSSTLSGLTVQDLEKAYKTIKIELL